MRWNTKQFWLTVLVMVAAITSAALAFGQQPQQARTTSRGPFGVLNWTKTETYPSAEWPSVPTQHTNALCITSDDTAPGKLPPSGVGGVVAASVVPEVNYMALGLVVVGGLSAGALVGTLLLVLNLRNHARSKRKK